MELRQHYQGAHQRLLLLDYDGVLVDFASRAAAATPTPLVLELLRSLAADPLNTVVVTSGRDHQTLDAWLGHLPIGLSAEHGLYNKLQGGEWQATRALGQDWKAPVIRLMQTAAVPGSEIEEKSMSLVWHYRRCDPGLAGRAAQHLITDLQMQSDIGLKVMHGHKIVEVTGSGTDKGQAARVWLATGDYDFVLAAGDDVTDEDLFIALPPEAYKIKVGAPSPSATFTVADPDALLELLRQISAPYASAP